MERILNAETARSGNRDPGQAPALQRELDAATAAHDAAVVAREALMNS